MIYSLQILTYEALCKNQSYHIQKPCMTNTLRMQPSCVAITFDVQSDTNQTQRYLSFNMHLV